LPIREIATAEDGFLVTKGLPANHAPDALEASRSQTRAELIEAHPADFAVDNRWNIVPLDADVAQFAVVEALQILESRAPALTDVQEVQYPGEQRRRWPRRRADFIEFCAIGHDIRLSMLFDGRR
jgi:hypothetical protein